MRLQIVKPRGQTDDNIRQRADEAAQPKVISGEQFRRDILGWSKRPFYALVQSGRIDHLRAINLCTARRTFYVRDKAEAWAGETATVRLKGLRPRHSQASR